MSETSDGEPIAEESVRVYRLRVIHPTESDEQLAVLAELPAARVTVAQRDLLELGLLLRSPDGWSALPPGRAAERLMARAELDIARRNLTLATVRARLHGLEAPFREALDRRSGAKGVEHVTGAAAVRAQVAGLAHGARRSVRAQVDAGSRITDGAAHPLPLDRELLRRGVRVRYLCADVHRGAPEFRDHVAEVCELGGEVRTVSAVPARLLVYDDAHALLPADPDRPERGTVGVREPALVGFLTALFDHLWARAVPFVENGPAHVRPPEGTELRVLRGIAAGRTNDALARELGVSPRTVTRIVAGLLERLGTDSRFRAGVRAVELGWLS
ncbi:helix-turn-helix transcriptional regulator [Streptomyces spiramenti]|uniref:Helix-turn-helix transcriptional regulator n=1 Tax=Streptomyces spiramenti TaxID=2720606 RepID=A0ABX1AJE2_9ACTN|nr:helix-turn-helix transcriptional regulator [Streptomyces spiramenti]NJP67244.1 helix-turn-helix transcriptional regulator [Streptomyces spiramenti]